MTVANPVVPPTPVLLPKDIHNTTSVLCALPTDNQVREYPAMHFGTIGFADPATGAEPTEVYIVLDWTHGTGFHPYYKRPSQPVGQIANTTPINALTADDISALIRQQLLELLGPVRPVGPTAPAQPTVPPQQSNPFAAPGVPGPVMPPAAPQLPQVPQAWTPPVPAQPAPQPPAGPQG